MLAPYIPEPSLWTPEKVNILVQGWAAGLSANQIRHELHNEFSRNAICGKIDRLKLPLRGKRLAIPKTGRPSKWHKLTPEQKTERGRRYRENRRNRQLPIYDLPPEPEPMSAANERPCQLLELTAHTCRWPVGDVGQPGFHFCGAEPKPEKPYCEHHFRISTVKPYYGPRKPWVKWRVRS